MNEWMNFRTVQEYVDIWHTWNERAVLEASHWKSKQDTKTEDLGTVLGSPNIYRIINNVEAIAFIVEMEASEGQVTWLEEFDKENIPEPVK